MSLHLARFDQSKKINLYSFLLVLWFFFFYMLGNDNAVLEL